ncbi:MAG: amino acid permease, partial [Candidatus Omnitrophota bacterium]
MNKVNSHAQDLKRVLGRWDSVAINIAIVLGVGIFITPSEVAKYSSSPRFIILAWIVGGIISLMGALCYAEISSSFPKTGGNYIYLRESYGPLIGFLFGWTELLVIRTGSIAAVSFIFAEYLKSFLSLQSDFLLKPIAILSVLTLSFINIIGLKQSKGIQNASVIFRILAIVGLVAFGFMFQKGNIAHFQCGSGSAQGGILQLFGLALIPILWTYGGWHENTFVAGETKDAKRTLPFALITGILIVAFLYVIVNFLYIYLISPGEMAGIPSIASKAMQILLGRYGEKFFDVLIIISSLGCLNAMIATGSRVTYAMVNDNVIFKFIGKVNIRHGTLARA